MDRIDWQRTRDILISVICGGFIFWACWSFMGQFFDAILILLLSMAVAFLVTPTVNLLVRYGFPRLLSCLVVYALCITAVVSLGYVLASTLIRQVQDFSTTIINFASVLPANLTSLQDLLTKQWSIPPQNIQNVLDQIQTQATAFAQQLATNALNFLFILTNAFLNIVLIVVLSFYLVLDGKRIRDSLISIAPKRSLPNVLLFEDALNRVVGNYIRGQLTLALIIGLFSSAICILTGLGNYALIVGVLAFLFETIPMVGPALASVPAILLSLLLPMPFPRTFWVIALFIVVQLLESNVLGPRIVGHAVGLHPVAAILALLIGARLFGVFGALLATPAVAALWVVIASIYRSARGESADQLLARRRAPWSLRRPGRMVRVKKRPGASHALARDGDSSVTDLPKPEPPTTTAGDGAPEEYEKRIPSN
jgi:predicted PurR-regulated permease PerM